MKNRIEIQNAINRIKLMEKNYIKEVGGEDKLTGDDAFLITLLRRERKAYEWVLEECEK